MPPIEPIHLRTAREDKGWTQERLEEASGVPQNTISRLERSSNSGVSAGTLLKLAEALDVDPRALRFGPDPAKERVA